MVDYVGRYEKQLFETADGIKAHRYVDRLLKAAKNGSLEAKQALARYMQSGSLAHVREHVAAQLQKIAIENDPVLAQSFDFGLTDGATRYWSIEGSIKVIGARAYDQLSRIALSSQYRTEERAKAIKCLAQHSGQSFDRQLPSDPGCWEESDLRLDELQLWIEQGYQPGQGYKAPQRHPALINPASEFEKVVASLDRKLATLRTLKQDPVNPSNWLVPADKIDIEQVKQKWNLPSLYLDFLCRFSPLNVQIPEHDGYFPSYFELFGASELIKGQLGYSVHGITGEPIPDWPSSHIVVARLGADPYVLDLRHSNGKDAPVQSAMHGTGQWEFEEVTESFQDFLVMLSQLPEHKERDEEDELEDKE